MYSAQLQFFDISGERPTQKVVNVSTVPQRSPFRYPGGKTWLVPTIRKWFGSRKRKPSHFIEPFTGGGSIALTAAFEDLADHITMVELDEDVSAVWLTILNGKGEWLANRIAQFVLTPESAKAVLSQETQACNERAFQTILKNRIQRGGILAKGAGWIREGEAGKGLLSRWYPETLSRRILDIARIKDRISFVTGDGIQAMCQYAHVRDALFFLDPPYTAGRGKKAGSRLYTHHQIDHDELFRVAAKLTGEFLMTYDDCPDLRTMAAQHGLQTALIPMKSTHHAQMNELLIGRDLSWIR